MSSASEVTTLWRYTNLFIIIIIIFLTPVLNSRGMKKYAVQYKKYKNQAGMNLTPPLPQNYREVRWHCTAIIIITTTIRGKVGGVAQW